MRTNNWEQKFNRILKKPEFDKFVRVALLFGGISAIVISCAKLNRTVIAPPMIPGASYVGTKACAECHEELVRDFKTASHARLQAKGNNAIAYGCESCHGPGSIHAKAGGGKDNIVNPKKSP
ncbi:MAG: hypothetical protein ACPMAG_05580, partial [Limisphaerales bacterium]